MIITSHSRLYAVIRYLARQAWLSSLIIAMVSYFMLHRYYLAVVPSDTTPATFWQQTTYMGQYLVPAFFVIQAVALLLRAKEPAKAVSLPMATRSPDKEALSKLSWWVFEHMCTSLYNSRGYQVCAPEETNTNEGTTLRLKKGTNVYLAQSKHWKTRQIDLAEVNELSDAMTAAGAIGGFIVTLGQFTPLAKTLARSRHIELTPVSEVFGMVGKRVPDPNQPAMVSTPYICPAYIPPISTETNSNATHVAGSCWQCGKFSTCNGTEDAAPDTRKLMLVTGQKQP